MKRTRLTISISCAVLKSVDQTIDGISIRNRSHAIETLLSEALNLVSLRNAIILAGGKDAINRIAAIESGLELLKKNAIFDVQIAVGFLGDKIKERLGGGQDFGMDIKYIEGGQGTGGALLPLKNEIKSSFVVLNLQEPVSCDLKNLIRFHLQHKVIATVASKSLKDQWGIYIFDPRIFSYLPKGFSMLEDDIFDKLIKEGELLAYPILS